MTPSRTTRRLTLAWLAATALSTSAFALDRPKGPAVLTLTGKVGAPNVGASVVFDAAMIQALPQHSFTTATPWFAKPVKFTGPRLADVLAAAKASGTSLRAVALNDYKVSIPASDAAQYDVIVARLIDDKPIPVREKGPLFVVYPFHTSIDLRSSRFYDRSIWQLKAIEVD